MSLLFGVFSKVKCDVVPDKDRFLKIIPRTDACCITEISAPGYFLVSSQSSIIHHSGTLTCYFTGISQSIGHGSIAFSDLIAEIFSNQSPGSPGTNPENLLQSVSAWSEGDLSLIIYDSVRHQLTLIHDQYGSNVLYYWENSSYVFFSNFLNRDCLTLMDSVSCDLASVYDYFSLGSVLIDRTLIRGVSQLMAGQCLQFHDSLSNSTILHPEISIDYSSTVDELAEEAASLLKHAVQRRISAVPDVRIMLTGGVDTRLILGCLNREQYQDFDFVTFLTDPLRADQDQEVIIARLISEKYNLQHSVEPFPYNNMEFDTWYFEDQNSMNSPVFMAGLFGSELLKGEFIFSLIPELIQRFHNRHSFDVPKDLQYTLQPSCVQDLENHEFKNIFIPSDAVKIRNDAINRMNGSLQDDHRQNSELNFAVNSFLRSSFTSNWIQSEYNLPFICPHSTTRNLLLPFTDKDFIRFLLKVPPKLLGVFPEQLYATIYRNHFPALCNFPTNSAFGRIEGNIMRPVKSGLAPHNYRRILFSQNFDRITHNSYLKDLDLIKFPALNSSSIDKTGIWKKRVVEIGTYLKFLGF